MEAAFFGSSWLELTAFVPESIKALGFNPSWAGEKTA
jgi:hypothetical protein